MNIRWSCGLVLAIASPALGGTIVLTYKEGNTASVSTGLHGGVAANAGHVLTTGAPGAVGIGGMHWTFIGNITETEKVNAVNNDKVRVAFDVQHISNPAPHANEATPNLNKPAVDFTFEAGKAGVTAAGNLNNVGASKTVKHNAHVDCLEAVCMVLVNANNQDIEAYLPTFVTLHMQAPPEDRKSGKATLSSGALPTVFGGAAALIEVTTRTVALGISAANLSAASLTSAQIRQGTPATPGPTILSLPLAAFADAGTLGVASRLDPLTFPAPSMGDLLSGNTFVELVTAGGTVAGSLVVGPAAPLEADTPALSTWAFAMLIVLMVVAGYALLKRRGEASLSEDDSPSLH